MRVLTAIFSGAAEQVMQTALLEFQQLQAEQQRLAAEQLRAVMCACRPTCRHALIVILSALRAAQRSGKISLNVSKFRK